jgi:hypothetical protein
VQPARLLALAHGLYYAATGLWPWISLPTFEAVTGPKTDHWLVLTVGALVLAIAVALLDAARRDRPLEAWVLGIASAAAFLAVDVLFAGIERIVSPVYLLDAAPEAALVVLWAWAKRRGDER